MCLQASSNQGSTQHLSQRISIACLKAKLVMAIWAHPDSLWPLTSQVACMKSKGVEWSSLTLNTSRSQLLKLQWARVLMTRISQHHPNRKKFDLNQPSFTKSKVVHPTPWSRKLIRRTPTTVLMVLSQLEAQVQSNAMRVTGRGAASPKSCLPTSACRIMTCSTLKTVLMSATWPTTQQQLTSQKIMPDLYLPRKISVRWRKISPSILSKPQVLPQTRLRVPRVQNHEMRVTTRAHPLHRAPQVTSWGRNLRRISRDTITHRRCTQVSALIRYSSRTTWRGRVRRRMVRARAIIISATQKPWQTLRRLNLRLPIGVVDQASAAISTSRHWPRLSDPSVENHPINAVKRE